jgi:ferredoxin--NADP+ reductase
VAADRAPRAAVVGAGPSGFYAADALLRAGFRVDLFEALPTPFGLVRAGVAPDHPKIKAVTRVFDRTAARPGFRFLGGVEVGGDVAVDQLRERYEAVVLAVGAPDDRRLGIPGEEADGSSSSSAFVAWYNGHPDAADARFVLDAERAVVVGNGNVALDVARMLVLGRDRLASTDVADHALDALAGSAVREVVVLGRRGPAQAAFTTPELAELGRLDGVSVSVDPVQLALDPHSAAAVAEDPDLEHRIALLRDYAGRRVEEARTIALRFLRSPTEIVTEGGRVAGVRVAVNALERVGDRLAVRRTGAHETIDCGLVLRAVGYRGRKLPGIPFDPVAGVIPNRGGRVLDEAGRVRPGEYVTGWAKRGPSGVIGTNKQCAAETAAAIVADRDAGRLPLPAGTKAADAALDAWLSERCPHAIGWDGWTAIDAHEQAAGRPASRPRVKLVHRDRLRLAAGGAGP